MLVGRKSDDISWFKLLSIENLQGLPPSPPDKTVQIFVADINDPDAEHEIIGKHSRASTTTATSLLNYWDVILFSYKTAKESQRTC